MQAIEKAAELYFESLTPEERERLTFDEEDFMRSCLEKLEILQPVFAGLSQEELVQMSFVIGYFEGKRSG